MLLAPCNAFLGWQPWFLQTSSDDLKRVMYQAGHSFTDSLAHRKTKGFHTPPAHTPGGLASSTHG